MTSRDPAAGPARTAARSRLAVVGPAEVPLDVGEPGGADRRDHVGRVVQHEVESTASSSQLVTWRTSAPACSASTSSRPVRAAGPARRPPGSSDAARCMRRTTRDGAQPAAAGGRISLRRSPTSKDRSGAAPPRLGDHCRRQVDAGASAPAAARCAVTCPGPAAGDYDRQSRAATATRSSSQRSKGLRSSSSARRSAYARRDRVVRRPHLGVARRGPVGEHDSRSTAGAGGAAASSSTGPSRCTQRGPAGPAVARAAEPAAGRAGHPRSRPRPRSRSANGCSRSVRVAAPPGACGPRSSSTVSTARSSGWRSSRSSSRLVVLQRAPSGVRPTRCAPDPAPSAPISRSSIRSS